MPTRTLAGGILRKCEILNHPPALFNNQAMRMVNITGWGEGQNALMVDACEIQS
jgi:hypothetical protein